MDLGRFLEEPNKEYLLSFRICEEKMMKLLVPPELRGKPLYRSCRSQPSQKFLLTSIMIRIYSAVGDSLLKFDDVLVHVAYVLGVLEDECLVDIEPAGYDVLGIFDSPPAVFFERGLTFMEELFIIS
jgi:hypothetical protein